MAVMRAMAPTYAITEFTTLSAPKPTSRRSCPRSFVARLMISPVGMRRKKLGPSVCTFSMISLRRSNSTSRPTLKT